MVDDPLNAERILTARLVLTPLRIEDAAEMAGVLADPALHEFIGGEPLPLDMLTRRYRRLVRGRSDDGRERWLNWIVRKRAGGGAVGTVQATIGETEPPHASVAWIIGTSSQRLGYGAEAALALVTWLKERGCVVSAKIHPAHVASAKVAARAGLFVTEESDDGERVWRAR